MKLPKGIVVYMQKETEYSDVNIRLVDGIVLVRNERKTPN